MKGNQGADHITIGPMWHEGLNQNVDVIGQWLPGYMPTVGVFREEPDNAVLIRVGTILRLAPASSLSTPRDD